MPSQTSAVEKLNRKKHPKKVKLEYDFAGIKAGKTMFVGTPLLIDSLMRSIKHGETRTIPAFRNMLARRNKCDACCPVSTSIFIRMTAEAAIEQMNEGMKISEVAPFWRLLESGDKITIKLAIDPAWLDEQRALEASVSAN